MTLKVVTLTTLVSPAPHWFRGTVCLSKTTQLKYPTHPKVAGCTAYLTETTHQPEIHFKKIQIANAPSHWCSGSRQIATDDTTLSDRQPWKSIHVKTYLWRGSDSGQKPPGHSCPTNHKQWQFDDANKKIHAFSHSHNHHQRNGWLNNISPYITWNIIERID